ncbi:MAG: B12-binding domain-containing radical SAM protein, partial [Candidatus Sumerlaeia bacterium]
MEGINMSVSLNSGLEKNPASPKSVLFINPPSGLYRRDDRCQSRVEDQTVRVVFPPIDLAVFAAIAREQNMKAAIRDYPAPGGGDWDAFRNDLKSIQPDVVLFNATTATIRADLEVVRLVRAWNPNTFIIARGEYFERLGDALMLDDAAPDIAMFGEIEDNLRRLFSGENAQNLPGVLYVDEAGQVVRNAGPARVENLDRLPLPARDLINNEVYKSPETGNPITVIQANRGCPARCIFCPAGEVSGFRLRLRSPEKVMAELRDCVENHGIREFLFNGDTFTMKKSWLLDLCGLIRESGLQIRWGCNSRVDTMDAERARALKSAGCWVVAFGVESGDQQMLDHMRKGTRLEQAEEAIACCKAAGLATHAFFIIGLPWEDRKSLAATYAFLKKLDTDFFDINIAYPLPGTEYHELAQRDDLVCGEGSYAQAGVRSYALSAEELTRWRRNALLKLYMRPRYIARTLNRAIRTGNLGHYLGAAFMRLKGLVR